MPLAVITGAGSILCAVMEPDTPHPYRVPQQRRSQASLERLLDAAEDQIRSEGIESLTIASVVGRAGLSVGAFYARFPDRSSLLHALQNRFHDRMEPVLLAELKARAAEARDLEEAVACCIDTLVKYVTGESELSRAFMMTSVFDQVLRRRGEQVNRDRREALIAALMVHKDEIGHADPVLAIEMAYAIYAAFIRGGLVFGENHELYANIATQTMTRELKSALTQYLRGHTQV